MIILFYLNNFGFHLSSNHTRWSEFGSFFGGVVGPLLAFFSLLYLAIQIEMQWKENKEARLALEIKYREEYISLNLSQIKSRLKEPDEKLGFPMGELILRIHNDKKYREEVSELIKVGLSARAETLVIWVNIVAALSYLKSTNKNIYLNHLTQVNVQLGSDLCVALDEVVHFATGINFERHFAK
jgi:hypothetical protein